MWQNVLESMYWMTFHKVIILSTCDFMKIAGVLAIVRNKNQGTVVTNK